MGRVYKTAFVIPDLIRDRVLHGFNGLPPDPGAGVGMAMMFRAWVMPRALDCGGWTGLCGAGGASGFKLPATQYKSLTLKVLP